MKHRVWLIVLLCLVVSISLQAQDDLPTQEPLSDLLPVATVEPPLPTSEVLPTDSPLPTVEVPTETPTTLPTVEGLPSTETPLATEQIAPFPTENAVIIEEPETLPTVLPLLYSTSFEPNTTSALSATTGWISVTTAAGRALQAGSGALSVVYTGSSLKDSAVEARFLLNSGEGQITLRGYAAGLSTDGTLTLTHDQAVLMTQSADLTPNAWALLRLEIVGTQIQVSMDGVLLIDTSASESIAEGQAGFAAANGSMLRIDDFAVYGVNVSTTAPTEPPAASGLPLPMAPSTPTNVQATVNGGTITFSWDDTANETSYEFQVAPQFKETVNPDINPANLTTITLNGIGCGLTVGFRVRSVENGVASGWSNWITASTAPCTSICNPAAALQRVNVGTNGQQQSSNGKSNRSLLDDFNPFFFPVAAHLSNNGRYVLFASVQPLTGAGTAELSVEGGAVNDLYRYDTQTCITEKISLDESGGETAKAMMAGAISKDGSKGLFHQDPNILQPDGRVYLRDVTQGTTLRVPLGEAGNQIHFGADISDDNRYILLDNGLPLSGVADLNNTGDVVIYDTVANAFTPVSVTVNGLQTGSGESSGNQLFSVSGKLYAVFSSSAPDLILSGTSAHYNVFVRNVTDGSTAQITLTDADSSFTSVSSIRFVGAGVDGNTLTVAFLLTNTSQQQTLYARSVNLSTPSVGTTRTILSSTTADTILSPFFSHLVSDNGRWVVFTSKADGLVLGDTNQAYDVFVYDMVTQQTARVTTHHPSYGISISPDGSRILFMSDATTVVANDTNTLCYKSSPTSYYTNCPDLFLIANPLYVAPPPVLSIPTNVQASANGSTITVSWDDTSTGETGFEIASIPKFPGMMFPGKITAGDVTSTIFNDIGCGLTVWYRVRAVGSNGTFGQWSSWVSASTSPCAAACPNTAIKRVNVGSNNQYQASDGLYNQVGSPNEHNPNMNLNNLIGAYLSWDGRSVLFNSSQPLTKPSTTELLAEQAWVNDVYVHDTTTCLTEKVSLDETGAETVGAMMAGAYSQDGSKVAFFTDTFTNVGLGITGQPGRIYVRDLNTNITTRVALPDLIDASGYARYQVNDISNDGRYVLITHPQALDGIVDQNGLWDTIVYDMQTQTYVSASLNASGTANAGGQTEGLRLFQAGGKTYVILASNTTNLVSGPITTTIYLRNLTDGITTPLALNDDETPILTPLYYGGASLQGTQLRLVFSEASFTGMPEKLYVRTVDLASPTDGTTALIASEPTPPPLGLVANNLIVNEKGEALSGNGRWVIFTSVDNALVPNDTNPGADVFVYDLTTSNLARITSGISAPAYAVGISGDGTTILLSTTTSALVPNDTNTFCSNATDTSLNQNCVDLFVVANPLYVAPPAPTAPTNPQATISSSTVTLTWTDASSDETGFEIEGSGGFTTTVAANVTSVQIPNVACGQTVQYRVRAVNSTNSTTSAWSTYASVQTGSCTPTCDPDAALRPLLRTNGPMPVSFIISVWNVGYNLSADGRYAVFSSPTRMTDDPLEDTLEGQYEASDVYRYDTEDCTSVKTSVKPNGEDIGNTVWMGDISANARYVVMMEHGNTGSYWLRDLATNTSQRLADKGIVEVIDISSDGRWLFVTVMEGQASRLAVYDAATQTISFVKSYDNGVNVGGIGRRLFTVNGKVYVFFTSSQSNVVNGVTPCSSCYNYTFIRNMTDGVNISVPLASQPNDLTGVGTEFWDASLNGNILTIPFLLNVNEPSYPAYKLYVRTVDLTNPSAGTTTNIGRASGANGTLGDGYFYWPRISANGRWVFFNSDSTNLVPNDTEDITDVFVRDLVTHTTVRITDASGTPFVTGSSPLDISDDGSTLFFRNEIDDSLISPSGWPSNLFFADNPLYVETTLPPDPAPLDTPTLTAPADDLSSSSLTIAFSWSAVDDAAQYMLQLDESASFSIPELNILSTTPEHAFSQIKQGHYFWRVRAVNGTQWSEWSETREFTLNIAQTPVHNTVLTPPSPSTLAVDFTWADVKQGNQTYTLEISSNGGNTWTDQCRNTTSTTCRVAVLTGAYEWRVRLSDLPFLIPNFMGHHLTVNAYVPTAPAPRAPTLVSPVNGRILTPSERPAVLTWSWGTQAAPAGAPFTYALEIAKEATFAAPIVSVDGLTTAAYTTTDLPDGTYYWRVQAINAGGIPGAWSAAFRFVSDDTPPAEPVIVTPTHWSVVSSLRPTFTWKPVSGAVRYSVTLHTRACHLPDTPVHQNTGVRTTSYTIPASSPALRQGRYTLCLVAYDASDNPSERASVDFDVFLGISPAHHQIIAPTVIPVFQWAASPEVGKTVTYQVQIDPVGSFIGGQVQTSPAVTGTSRSWGQTLPAGHYHWRIVRLVNGQADGFEGGISRELHVTTLEAGPTLVEPPTTAVLNDNTDLTWLLANAPTGLTITDYEIVVSRSVTFAPVLASAVIDANEPLSYDFVPAANVNGVRHYWRVRGLMDGVAVTTWSNGSFMVDTVVPAKPNITFPTERALVNTVLPKFTWAIVPGAARYRLRLETMAGTEIISEQEVNTTFFTPPQALDQTKYMLYVQAGDGVNWSTVTTRIFTVRLGTLPAQGAVVTTPRPTFTWTAVPGAASYDLEIDNDPYFDDPVLGDGLPLRLISQIPAAQTQYTLSTDEMLIDKGRYYWRVRSDTLEYPTGFGSRAFIYGAAPNPAPINLRSLAVASSTPDRVLNKVETDPSFTLAWNALTPAPLSYEIHLSSTAAFAPATTQILMADLTDSVEVDSAGLTDGAKYWRVRAVYTLDATSIGPWSAVATFTFDKTDPAAPAVVNAPTHYNVLTPRFLWSASPGAVRYRLTLIDDVTNAPVTGYDKLIVPTTSYTVPLTAKLMQRTETTYSWIVQAEDAVGNLSQDLTEHPFTLSIAKTPAAAPFIADRTPLMSWSPHWNGGLLTLNISSDEAMNNIVRTYFNIPVNAVSFTIPNGDSLNPGRYYWRVLSTGQNDAADVHGQVFYVVDPLTKAVPTPMLPGNNDLLSANEISAGTSLTWTAPTEQSIIAILIGYQIEIAKTNTFTAASLVFSDSVIGDTSKALPALADGRYYWRVRGVFGASDMGPYSMVSSFIIDTAAPAAPVLRTPLSGALLTTTRPAFAWNAVAAATRYTLQIDVDEDFSTGATSIIVNAPALAHTLTAAQPLTPGTYYWRVLAEDAAGNVSAASVVRRFTLK